MIGTVVRVYKPLIENKDRTPFPLKWHGVRGRIVRASGLNDLYTVQSLDNPDDYYSFFIDEMTLLS